MLDSFKETNEEANRLALSMNRLKGLNNYFKNKVNTLEEKLKNTKYDFKNLEIMYKKSSCKCVESSKLVKNCENCEV